jgi:hypothetical protein
MMDKVTEDKLYTRYSLNFILSFLRAKIDVFKGTLSPPFKEWSA